MRVSCKKESQRRRRTVTQWTSASVYRQISNWTLWFYSISEKSNKGMPKIVERSRKTEREEETPEFNQKDGQRVIEIEG